MAKPDMLQASIKQERTRLKKARDKAARKKAEIDGELEAIERELAAIAAYEQARGGKPARAAKRAAGKRATAPRARRGEKRRAVVDLIKQHPGGLSRGEILNLMGVKGDKSGEQSVSNALSALTKQNLLGRHEGKYVAA
jgi:hypothetical protein